jgi:hypothetical protein
LLLARAQNPIFASLGLLASQVDLLKNILAARSFDERLATARRTLQNPGLRKVFDAVATTLRGIVTDASVNASDTARGALIQAMTDAQGEQKDAIQQIQDYYDNYQGYDFVSFPVIYATNVGEELSTTEVIRISPEDATGLVNRALGDRRRKLAGTVLMHFGAFMEQKWRLNDMLWGRLDAAERLIASLLPLSCPNIRDALIKEAHIAILEEHFRPLNSNALLNYSSELINHRGVTDSDTARLKDFLTAGAGTPSDATLAPVLGAALRQSMAPEKLLSFFKDPNGYEVSIAPTPDTSASAASRATTVFGKMLTKIGTDLQYDPLNTAGIWTTRAGQLAWSFVEVAMPGRMGRLFWHYWLKVAYLVEVILILGGWALQNSSAEVLGWKLFALTLLANVTTWALGDWLAASTRARRRIRGVIVVLLLLLVGLGGYTAWCWLHSLKLPALNA